ncbi:MAG: S9 family peptidase [Deltaproteobacteria bacterium]|nr:S9 family peptidase [Deltaproteobacteria bacterium]
MTLSRTTLSLIALVLTACASAPPAASDAPVPACPACPPAAPADKAPAPAGPLIFGGTPPVPDALKAQLQRYLEARSAGVVAIDERGTALLVATRFGSAAQIHRVAAPLGARTQVTFEAEPVSRAELVPGDDRAFVFLRDTGGDEQFQIHRTDLDTGRVVRLTDGKSRHEGWLFSPDGASFVFTSNARNGKDFDLWIGDGKDPAKNRILLEVSGRWSPLDWSPDGKTLVVQQYVSITDQRLHLVDVATGKVTAVTSATPASSNRDALFARGAGREGRLYVTSDRAGDFVALYEVDPAAGTWTALTPTLPWNVDELALSPDGKTLAFVVNEDGYGRLHLIDTTTRKALPRPKIPDGIVSGIRFARKAPVLAFTFSGATVNGDAYTWHLGRRQLTRWTESEIGGLDARAFVEPELFRYKTFDGREIPCFLYRPRGAGPFPVVVQIHGGPESQSRPGFSAVAQLLVAEAGVAVLVPNVRGSDGYGKAYLALDDGRLREDSVKDIGALLDWIPSRPELDAGRVGVFGGSYGGYMVLASLVHFGDRIRAGVDVVGISNFVTFLEATAPYRRDLRRVEYGDESDPAMREFLLSISPTTNAHKIKSALFVVHGANDPRVPLGEAEQIAAVVKKSGLPVWTLVAMNEGHGFAKRENRDAYLQLTVLFFQEMLKKQ